MILIFVFIASFSISAVSGGEPTETCAVSWKKIGCFRDRIDPDRPLPQQLVNHRDISSEVYDGHILSWKNWPQSLHALACRCAELTKQRGHQYFGLQFFGECWSGPSHQFYRDGPSENCIGVDFKTCDNKVSSECIGGPFTNYIYDISEVTKTKNCKNKLEFGVITDASTSVRSKNYEKVKEFVVKLTEQFDVGADSVRFGMIHFSWDAHLDFSMKEEEYWDPTALKRKIMSSEYIYGGTRTDLALYKADKELFCDECVRPGVPKFLIVLTDGRSSGTSDPMPVATKGLKAKGVTIITIGIGHKIDTSELLEIASDRDHVFLIKDFDDLVEKLSDILKLSCGQ